MQKVFLYPVFFMILIAAACTKSEKQLVQMTGEDFLAAIIADNFTEFRTMVTPETYEKWGTTAYHSYTALSSETKTKLQSAPHRINDIVVNGKVAEATLPVGLSSETGEITVLHFKKIGRVWFINEPGLLVAKSD